MKKVLLSLTAVAMSLASYAQVPFQGGSDYFIFNFNGTQTANCGTIVQNVSDAFIPDSRYNQPSYTNYSFNGSQIVINKQDPSSDVTANAWHKIPFTFVTDCNTPKTIDLSNHSTADHFEMQVYSSVAVPQAMVFFRQGTKYNDNNPWVGPLVAGDNNIKFTSKIDWGIYGQPKSANLDSANVDGIAIAFRTAWNDNSPLTATIRIDYINVGNYASHTSVAGNTASVLPTSVNYYPNPSNSVIKVDNMDVTSLKLLNSNGAFVKEVSGASQISVEGLNPGLYFLQINDFKPVKVTVE